ncbi:hypothetical protein SAICODRAFT_210652 [Saitoella complicata NRRL Y-17804]|uniref:uncharacterized protein n=1 Tax=Saitoella complicata (strain BCRC 22490 / CBS 7301 / JCM 7358 / NBRC 10748 / NRRL Y-17804) TaxID=698492 RepID=UPI000868067F|nr:uncharacterized protein SAICODRAFT_210652 [Saitoella complicata NRRL Y-17804]ODQ54453.1 hypothetical protein SAICODRAFT_210652 [Saitoella complicata NRRL Y-17804]
MSESEPSQALYYCHECQDEWNAQETDVGMPCPRCGSVIDQGADPRDLLHDDGDDFEDDDEYDDDEDVDGLGFNVAGPGGMPPFMFGNIAGNNTDHGPNREMMGMLQGLLQQFIGGRQPPPRADSNENGHTTSVDMPAQPQQAAGANVQFTFGSMAAGLGVAGTGRGDRQENGSGHVPVTDLSTFLQQAFGALAGGPADGGFAFGGGNGQAGGGLGRNLGDYVFSNRGFDEVVSRLMEQHQGSDAPPPTPEYVINAIPAFLVDENIAKSEWDCAVCKDDWQIGETALRLPCSHCFHDQCIKPWLKVNSTCPVCRSSVLGSGTAQRSAEQAGGSSVEGVTVATQASSSTSHQMPGSYPASASAPDILEQDDLD